MQTLKKKKKHISFVKGYEKRKTNKAKIRDL